MSGVSADEDAAVLKTIGHQAAPDPVFLRNHVVSKIVADPEDRACIQRATFRQRVPPDTPALDASARHVARAEH